MESSGPPARAPRTFPHPSEILSLPCRHPPRITRSSHSRDDGEAIYPFGFGGKDKRHRPSRMPRSESPSSGRVSRPERKARRLGRRLLPVGLKECADLGEGLKRYGLTPCRVSKLHPHCPE